MIHPMDDGPMDPMAFTGRDFPAIPSRTGTPPITPTRERRFIRSPKEPMA